MIAIGQFNVKIDSQMVLGDRYQFQRLKERSIVLSSTGQATAKYNEVNSESEIGIVQGFLIVEDVYF